MRSRFAFLILAVLILSTSVLAQDQNPPPPIVSLVQLLSSPEKYDGKHIAVMGFLTIGQENNVLYLGKNDYDNALLPNSVWIELSDGMIKNRNELTMKYVRVVGVFHQGHSGRSRVFVGGISGISDCSVLSDPDHPFSEKLKGLVRHDPVSD